MSSFVAPSSSKTPSLRTAPPARDGAQAAEAENAAAARRHAVMAVLAEATLEELELAWEAFSPQPRVAVLRRPEVGLVMVRGRIGGDGAPFNVGEATVTRASVRLDTGEEGAAWLLGRDPARTHLAAVFEALCQRPQSRPACEQILLEPVRARIAADRARRAAQVAATKVEFFTMVRGEDA